MIIVIICKIKHVFQKYFFTSQDQIRQKKLQVESKNGHFFSHTAILELDSCDLVHRSGSAQGIHIRSPKLKFLKITLKKYQFKFQKLEEMERPRKKDTIKGLEDSWLKFDVLPNFSSGILTFKFNSTFSNCKCVKEGDKNENI